ncbi:MAG TPA: hypothetical protein VEQ63_05700, partial [Bryobacteraceae bacterium]|nr:hypothetical protein [Bryobacteraceae bacterium]
DIYYYERQFTRTEARLVAGELQCRHIPYRLLEHSEENGPDAVYIGPLVEASDARMVLQLVPYEISFLFRPDYPEAEGGDSSGYKIGVGYSSTYNAGRRGRRAEPMAVSRSLLSELLDENHTNTSFQRCLWSLALGSSSGK